MTTAAVSLPPPRRKARVREVPGAALPLPSALPHPPCTHYEATYSLGHITIRDPRQAAALWHNGYFGHGMETGGSGKPRGKKKWRLVEADGLKGRQWFKETHEAGRWRGGKGGVEEKGEEVEKNETEMKEEEEEEEEEEVEVDMKEKKEEEEEEEEERQWEMEEIKEEDADKEEKKEEEEEKRIRNDKEDKTKEEMEETDDKLKEEGENKEERETVKIEKDEGSVEKKEKEEEEMERSTKEEENVEEEEGEGENADRTPEHPIEEPEESDEELTNNHTEDAEMRSDGEDYEPWRTVLVLSGDQEANTDTHDPHSYLTLLPEEALFLSYALGCLVLTYTEPPVSRKPGKRALGEQHTHEMTIDEMWRVFTQDDPAFPVKYAAFHHFRTQGWVVKGGLKYGVDYVLYPVGPPFYHSQYAVKIHSVWSDTLALDHTLPSHEMTWTTIATTERLSNHINKTPVICFVLRPRSLTQSRLGLIECLKELKVQEVVLSRWNPSDGSG